VAAPRVSGSRFIPCGAVSTNSLSNCVGSGSSSKWEKRLVTDGTPSRPSSSTGLLSKKVSQWTKSMKNFGAPSSSSDKQRDLNFYSENDKGFSRTQRSTSSSEDEFSQKSRQSQKHYVKQQQPPKQQHYSQQYHKQQPPLPPPSHHVQRSSQHHHSQHDSRYHQDRSHHSHSLQSRSSRSTEVVGDVDIHQMRGGMGKPSDSEEHTFATATTAEATTSYSLDEASASSEHGDDGIDRSGYTAHSFKAGSHTFTVDTKYSFIRVIGSGAYGVVISANDAKSESKVAIKMVPKAFHDEVDAKRILREIKLLKHLHHENIISILDMMPPTCRHVEDYNDVYIVADLMETDLHRIIYSKQALSIDHVQYFLYQILRALKYLHSANVLHRDLKPSNLLVNSNCDLKVCDFGLARGVLPEEEQEPKSSSLLTEYVVTRWYRAPEIMLACHEYDKPIDVWSVGCIFAELLGRKPFFPGDDCIDQLTLICGKLGKLPEEDFDFITSEKAKRFMRKLPDKAHPSLRRQLPNTPPEALDLLSKMLQIHPRKRITVEEALEHPFMGPLHSPDDEPVAETPFDFSFEDEKLHRVRLQELIWEEVGDFRPHCLPVPPRKDTGHRRTRSGSRKLFTA